MFLADSLPNLIAHFGYVVVGVVVALEGMGIPLPGETALILAAVYAERTHQLHIAFVIAAAGVGAIIGDNIGYWIGREVGYRLVLRFGRYVGLNEKRIKLGQYLFQRHGGKVVFVARFVAVLRTIAPLLAGLNCMPWRRFIPANAAGGLLWATVYGSGAYFLGRGIEHAAKPAAIAIGVVAVIGLVAGVMFLRRHEARLQEEAERALPGPLRTPGRGRSRLAARRA